MTGSSIIGQLKTTEVRPDGKPGLQVQVRTDRVIRIHVLIAHEPARLIGTDGQQGEVNGSMTLANGLEVRGVPGVPRKEHLPCAHVRQPRGQSGAGTIFHPRGPAFALRCALPAQKVGERAPRGRMRIEEIAAIKVIRRWAVVPRSSAHRTEQGTQETQLAQEDSTPSDSHEHSHSCCACPCVPGRFC